MFEAVVSTWIEYAGEAVVTGKAADLDHLNGSEADERWMLRALELAEAGAALGEVPVGAVVVLDGRAIGEGCNRPISDCDPTAHAEVVALRAAARTVGNYRLTGATLYVTVEPCTMCAGSLVHARVARVVFGAPEPRSGAIVTTARVLDNPGHNHRVEVTAGVLAEACGARLKAFFAARRTVGSQPPASDPERLLAAAGRATARADIPGAPDAGAPDLDEVTES